MWLEAKFVEDILSMNSSENNNESTWNHVFKLPTNTPVNNTPAFLVLASYNFFSSFSFNACNGTNNQPFYKL
jgi:hypothetical protein